MNAFYNKEGVGDVLLVRLQDKAPEGLRTETSGDVTTIKDEGGELSGFNLFKASQYLSLNAKGSVELSEELISGLQNALNQNNVDYTLEIDLTPKFVVGYVEELEKHPNADKLSVCRVNTGNEKLQIVCGAPNIAAGQKVVVAKVGAVMPSGLVIKDAELRGVASSGMICSAKELAIPDAPQEKGILVLAEDAQVGTPFSVKG